MSICQHAGGTLPTHFEPGLIHTLQYKRQIGFVSANDETGIISIKQNFTPFVSCIVLDSSNQEIELV
jgi:hypothetical protein